MGSVRDYINEFTTLMLEKSDMSDRDSLFYFQDNLKDWAKTELNRWGVQTLDDTIIIVKSLTEYSTQSKDKRHNQGKGMGESRKDEGNNYKDWGQKRHHSNKSRQGKLEGKKELPKPKSPCLICDGPHWVHDCLEKQVV